MMPSDCLRIISNDAFGLSLNDSILHRWVVVVDDDMQKDGSIDSLGCAFCDVAAKLERQKCSKTEAAKV